MENGNKARNLKKRNGGQVPNRWQLIWENARASWFYSLAQKKEGQPLATRYSRKRREGTSMSGEAVVFHGRYWFEGEIIVKTGKV